MANIDIEPEYRRFAVIHRILHISVMFCFTGLAITGFSIKFGTTWWSRVVLYITGGPTNILHVHRWLGAILYLTVITHLLWLFYYKFYMKGSLTGPQSIFPRISDVKDLFQNLRYFFGKGDPPHFNRFTYWEKLDYWAVMLGMQSMGITGLVLTYPESFARIFPGYYINIARVLHSHEAILAVLYIAVVHMAATHLYPDSFPLEKSIFTGRIPMERMLKDHPGELKAKEGDTATTLSN